MEYAYVKLMQQEKLTLSELPEDAQVGIQSIRDMEKMLKLAERKGTKVRPQTLKKLQAFDKWIVREILDQVEEKDTNSEAPPVSAEAIKDEIKEEIDSKDDKPKDDGKDEVKLDPKGLAIEAELKALEESDKKEYTLDEVKAKASKAYSTIFENYTDDGENGIQTSTYLLKETAEKIFTISKN